MADASNIEMLCCISNRNKELQSIIKQQSNTIGVLLQEKKNIQEQYKMLLNSIDLHSITSNIEHSNTSNM